MAWTGADLDFALLPSIGSELGCKKESGDSVGNALAEFERCVPAGARPETHVDDFIRTMKGVEALTLSAQRGAEVHLDELEREHA